MGMRKDTRSERQCAKVARDIQHTGGYLTG